MHRERSAVKPKNKYAIPAKGAICRPRPNPLDCYVIHPHLPRFSNANVTR